MPAHDSEHCDDLESKPFLSTSSSTTSLPISQSNLSSRKKLLITNLLTFITTTLLCTLIISVFFKTRLPTAPRTKMLSCGTTVEDARANGCTYDILSNLWVPTPCLETSTIEEFRTTAPWQGYSDRNATRLLTEIEMSEQTKEKGGYWTPAREHLVHCSLMWKRLHKAYLAGEEGKRWLDANTRRWEHTVHCSMSQVELGDATPEQLEQIVILTTAGFSDCEVEY